MILRILKMGTAIGIFFCMFVPLSQCTYTSPRELADESTQEIPVASSRERKVTVLIISEKIPELELVEYWIPLTFIAPILFSIPFHHRRKRFIIIQSVQTVYSLWLAFFVFNAVYSFHEPLYGGYLLTVLACVFGILTAVEWFKYVKKA